MITNATITKLFTWKKVVSYGRALLHASFLSCCREWTNVEAFRKNTSAYDYPQT